MDITKLIKIVNMGKENFNRVDVGNLSLFFSYDTLIAFTDGQTYKNYCSVNDWSNTTGKHLNQIQPDKKLRIPYVVLVEELKKVYLRDGFLNAEIGRAL